MGRLLWCACALWWWLMGPAMAAPAGVPVQVFTTAYPPYVGPDLPDLGAAARLLRELLEPQGLVPVIEFRPWARLGQELQAGHVDLVLLAWPGDLRQHRLLEGVALFGSQLGLFVRPSDWRAGGWPPDQMRGLNVGLVRDYAYPESIRTLAMAFELANSDLQNLRKLAAGRIDAVMLERAVGQHLLSQAGPELAGAGLVWQEPALVRVPMYAAIPAARPLTDSLQRALVDGLKAYRADGRYARLLHTYGLSPPP